jgi:hypothetical protein
MIGMQGWTAVPAAQSERGRRQAPLATLCIDNNPPLDWFQRARMIAINTRAAAKRAPMKPACAAHRPLQTHSEERAGSLVPGSAVSYWARNALMYAMRNRKKTFGKFLEAEWLATEALLERAK